MTLNWMEAVQQCAKVGCKALAYPYVASVVTTPPLWLVQCAAGHRTCSTVEVIGI